VIGERHSYAGDAGLGARRTHLMQIIDLLGDGVNDAG